MTAVNVSPQVKQLLGGAGVLQVALTVVGVTNGGVSAMAINHRTWVLVGFGSVGVAVAIGALIVAFNIDGRVLGPLLPRVGAVLLIVGIGVTAYLALVGPAVAKAPSIDVVLSQSSGQLVLTARVKASGIPESSQYWFEIDAREYRREGDGGKYDTLGTPLYQNQLGADSAGDIDSMVTIPLPPGSYPAVSVEAWNGAHAGPCGSLEVPGGASLTHSTHVESTIEENSRVGCVIVRLPASAITPERGASERKKRG